MFSLVISKQQITSTEEKKRAKSADTEITGVFKAYVAAWVDKVVADEIQEACFPIDLDKYQRKVSLNPYGVGPWNTENEIIEAISTFQSMERSSSFFCSFAKGSI